MRIGCEHDRDRLTDLLARERATLAARTGASRTLAERANAHMIGGVPMQWMQIWAGQHAIFFDRAKGNRIWDADGNELIDFCLGDTGAMALGGALASFAILTKTELLLIVIGGIYVVESLSVMQAGLIGLAVAGLGFVTLLEITARSRLELDPSYRTLGPVRFRATAAALAHSLLH